MPEWVAPAKVNLDLRVGPAHAGGFHPLSSLVQTIEWCDRIGFEEAGEDRLEVAGAELDPGADNLVWKAVAALELPLRPRLRITLDKAIPMAAGLGGGSADAAATLAGVCDLVGADADLATRTAPRVGADVRYLLTGGTARMEGYGEMITPLPPLTGFSLGVVVPPGELATPAVYRRWDELEGPVGPTVEGVALPPPLRRFGDLRNDLTPAAIDLAPDLADWISDLAASWSRPVLMSGSGPSLFAFFLDVEEAKAAVGTVDGHRGAVGADLRRGGVERVE